MKKLCCKKPKAAISPSFSGKRIIQEVMAAARIGVGTVAAKNITGLPPGVIRILSGLTKVL